MAILRRPMAVFGLGLVALLVLMALAAPLLAPFDPLRQHPGEELLPPNETFLLGTDEFGRDVLSRIIYGSRTSLLVGVIAVAIGAGVGVPTGIIAGYYGGWVDALIMRLWDGLLAFPAILLGIAIITVLGPGTLNAAYALALATMPQFSRLARSSVLSEMEKDYVQAAIILGARDLRVMVRHLLPNTLGPLLVMLSLSMAFAVLLEAGLSFLGLGTQPPQPSWGGMLNDSRPYLRAAPWYGVFPGVALAVLLLGLTYLSETLQDVVDPRRRSARAAPEVPGPAGAGQSAGQR